MPTLGALWSLLLLVSISGVQAATPAQQWPHNLAAHEKYWPEDGPNQRRDLSQQAPLHKPAVIKKMGGDEGEKFFMHYWEYESSQSVEAQVYHGGNTSERTLRPRAEEYANSSMLLPFIPPLRLHSQTSPNPHLERDRSFLSGRFGRSLQQRDFKCPTGSADCADIGRPNTCCNQGEQCYIIPDTGFGDVGCCPPGKGCSGNLNNCDLGFTKCSDNLGGGCCIPKYVCVEIGCGPGPELASLLFTTLTATTTKLSNPPTASPSTNTTSSTTTSARQSTTTCTSGFKSCPASLGGGCCREDRLCGAAACPPTSAASPSSGTVPPNAPVRPTGTTTAPSAPPSTVTGTDCPTGFYQCSAVYKGGCCRVGRDCDTASCPGTSSTLIASDGATVVVGGGLTAPPSSGPSTSASAAAATASGSGTCATGWFSCPASLSGGCCPSGFACGISNCQATATATSGGPAGGSVTANVAKQSANAAVRTRAREWGPTIGLGVVLLVLF
ncbi:MAG: hypothetical protein M1832_003998 [Thelocarpon impressellum]|nr:MAG: hypothetical protein M1832_003998 [Thelocarpon impressellum]